MVIRNSRNLEEGEYWMYLRKSQADLAAEARGEGETLAKHRKALFRLAKEMNINVTRVFPEIVSGESIFHRPEMVKMLQDMELSPPKGVLVMDIDRLGRGDKIDQGMIERAFKTSKTLIITPMETYDMNDESGEFNVEVRSFLARMELKQITKRMQGGRVRAVEDGNYIGARAPYGYQVHKSDKERYLVPHPEQAPAVKMIFELYTSDDPEKRMGSNKIANKLNQLKIPTYTGKQWDPSTVLSIIKNAVYIGRMQWKKKEQKKSREPGKKRDTRTRPRSEWIDAKGKHEPLIDEATFQKAQEILKGKYHVPYQLQNGITNPLAGLIRCGLCGSSMILRSYATQPPHVMCYNRFCQNKSSRFAHVEEKLLDALERWIQQYKRQWSSRTRPEPEAESTNALHVTEAALKNARKQLAELESQKANLHDLLERKVYDEAMFLERSQNLVNRIAETQIAITAAEQVLKTEGKREKAQKEIVPQVESVLKLYNRSKDPAKKNLLLKSILENATYLKDKTQRNSDFTLELHTRIPQ